MAVKECGSHESKSPGVCKRHIICIIMIFIVTMVIIGSVLTCIITLQRPKPRFVLQDATVLSFKVSGNPPNLLTSNFQITLSFRNSNDKIGFFYDRLDVYASYQSQQITLATSIPSTTYQEHDIVTVYSTLVGGNSVPIAPSNALSLDQEQKRGAVKLVVHIDGHFRWKVGPFPRTSSLYVKCPAYIDFGNSTVRAIVGCNGDCSVSF